MSETKMRLRAQVVMQDRQNQLDERVDKLASAIGALVAQREAL